MKLMHWDPYSNMTDIHNELNKYLTTPELFGPMTKQRTTENFVPAVDVVQRGDDLVFLAELPGMKKDDVTIEIEDGRLTLSGERKFKEETTKDDLYRMECSYGRFQRVFTLPTNVDATHAKAHFEDGILELTLPRLETAKPRRVEIDAD